jgi:fatty-acyl-CoA synthase
MNIYPREIEEFLQTHPAVAEAAVIGIPDEVWGEQIAAVIRLDPASPAAGRPTADELRAFCRAQMSAHKTPRYWSFIDAMPATPTGKIQKFVLRDQLAQGDLRVETVPTASSKPTFMDT